MKGIPAELVELRAAESAMTGELSKALPLLERYVIYADEDQPSGFSGHLASHPHSGSGTAAAFCTFLLAKSGLLLDQRVSDSIRVGLRHQIDKTCVARLHKTAGAPPANAEIRAVAKQELQAGAGDELSNYKLPIYLAGIAALTTSGLAASAMTLPAVKEALQVLFARLTLGGGGALTRVGAYAMNEPSAYHTYWAAQALREVVYSTPLWSDLEQQVRDRIVGAIAAIRGWAERAVASLIADHHAGIASRFDPVELVCAAALAMQELEAAGGKLQGIRPSNESIRLIEHGLAILFQNYFGDGSLSRSKPVYSDADKNSIFCSTPEALFYLVAPMEATRSPDSDALAQSRSVANLGDHLGSLLKAFALQSRNRSPDGYLPDLDGGFGAQPQANAFSTYASACFFKCTIAAIDSELDRTARKVLQVPAFIRDDVAGSRPYPKRLGEILSYYVIEPLTQGRRAQAQYSMILHGPPGTSKTTLARRLAQDLGWPLLEITQRDFLADGTVFIDAAADRIFNLVGLLRDVVVLFDELEELIGSREPSSDHRPERESRLLTTSMLPRIQELRDRKRIVFIFATNRISSFDSAATRPGRFDIIQLVSPPTAQAIKDYLGSLLKKALPAAASAQAPTPPTSANLERFITAIRDIRPINGMTYKDAELFFEELRRSIVLQGKNPGPDEITELMEVYQSIKDEVAARFKKLSESHDRPR